MADYHGTTLCKEPFAVKEPDKFEKVLRKHGLRMEKESSDVELWYDRNGNKFEIYGYSSLYFYDSRKGESVEVSDIIQPYLVPGEVAAFVEVGTTKCRYDEGCAYALIITSKETKWLSLHDWIKYNSEELRNKEFHIENGTNKKSAEDELYQQVQL